jgi:photosystem II stability/assembly factor-like uncharacterized protein
LKDAGTGSRYRRAAAIVSVSLLFALMPSAAAESHAWTTHGPLGGRVLKVVVDPQDPRTLYATTLEGPQVVKSMDGGASWSAAATGIGGRYGCFVQSLAIDPTDGQILYAGTCDNGLFKTTDGGANWSAIGDQPWPDLIPSLAIDPKDPRVVYAGTAGSSEGGVWRSADAGQTWTNSNQSPLSEATALLVDPVDTRVIYAASEGVYRSTDAGTTWRPMTDGLPARRYYGALAIGPGDHQILYAGSDRGAVYRTTDGGATWTSERAGLQAAGLGHTVISALAIDPTDTDVIHAGTGGGIFTSMDGGDTWTQGHTGTDLWVNDLVIAPGDPLTLFAGTEAGVFASIDDGDHWRATNMGMQSLSVRSLVIDPSGHDLWTAAGSGSVFGSADAGASWFDTTLRGGVGPLAVDPSNERTLYGGIVSYKGGLYRSTDRGKRWTFLGLRGHYVAALAVDPSDSDTLYVGGSTGGVFRSLDGGRTWQHLYGQRVEVASLAIDPAGRIFVGTKQHGVLVSSDGGATWTSVYLPGFVGAFAFGPNGSVYVAADGVFRSTDGGLTWNHLGLGRKAVSSLVIDPTDGRVLFAGTWVGVLESRNGGRSWEPVSAGSPLRYVTALAIDPSGSTLHAGTDFSGVYELQL